MSEKTLKDAAGMALYLEFRLEHYTTQVIVTPAAIGLDGKVIPSYFMRRRISTWSPRANWNIDRTLDVIGDPRRPTEMSLERDPATGVFAKFPDADKSLQLLIQNVAYSLRVQVDTLSNQSWSIFKKPMVVEASYADLSDLDEYRTPNQLVRRIVRSRVGAGWGESLTAAAPATV